MRKRKTDKRLSNDLQIAQYKISHHNIYIHIYRKMRKMVMGNEDGVLDWCCSAGAFAVNR